MVDSSRPPFIGWGLRPDSLGGCSLDQKTPTVLLAVCGEREPDEALQRARALCDVFDGDLSLLRVVSAARTSRRERFQDVGTRGEASGMAGRAVGWWQRILGEELAGNRFHFSSKDFASAVTSGAEAIRPSLLVISGHEARSGALVRRIVRDTNIPVLVARGLGEGATVVAATDLSDARYPVLRAGLRIARGQVAPLVFVHNARPKASRTSSEGAVCASLVSLEEVGRELSSQCSRITANRADSADAILELAEKRYADLIVVGTHVRRSLRRVAEQASVARQVVERAVGSVLVVPVGV